MSFDTKYRPLRYEDLLGQDATVAVLRQFVKSGSGFHQSYLFCGPFGTGKTTTARILARALLCENPLNGDPCDQCDSCRSILEKGSSECFTEQDAATKSGKDNILKITEDIQYSTFSGKRRIYLFDEAHALSKQALDSLLEPLEGVAQGTQDKKMVCIFCTTEPEKMRATVFSRCAPAFVIKTVPPEIVAKRLAWVCEQEKLSYEMDALILIAEFVNCHIRDALKAVEGVSMLGAVDMANVQRYLRTDVNGVLVQILGMLGTELGEALKLVEDVCMSVSPTTIYERLVDLCMLAFKVRLKAAKIPACWNAKDVAELGDLHGDFLVAFATHMARRPTHLTAAMLAMDIALLHQMRTGGQPIQKLPPKQIVCEKVEPNTKEVSEKGVETSFGRTSMPIGGTVASAPTRAYETESGVYIEPRAIKKTVPHDGSTEKSSSTLVPADFKQALAVRFRELKNDPKQQRQTRRDDLGSPGTDPSGGTAG